MGPAKMNAHELTWHCRHSPAVLQKGQELRQEGQPSIQHVWPACHKRKHLLSLRRPCIVEASSCLVTCVHTCWLVMGMFLWFSPFMPYTKQGVAVALDDSDRQSNDQS